MAQVKYVGIHDAVEIELPSGARVLAARGEPIETTAEHAGALVSTTSGMWELVKSTKAGKEASE